MISPTGKGIRSDAAGNGLHNTPRGDRRHDGVDFLCDPGQVVRMPIEQGMIVRTSYPYVGVSDYEGIYIEGFERGHAIELLLFYVAATVAPNLMYHQGDPIALAQDISKRYGPPMKSHVHLRITKIDPLVFFAGGPWGTTA